MKVINKTCRDSLTRQNPILYIIIPCYNEESVLPKTAPMFLHKLEDCIQKGLISSESKILFVNDGSRDKTWDIIWELSQSNRAYLGISQSRNRGHQNAVLAGLMEAKELCDITVSIDCDGQDDIEAVEAMVREYLNGNEVVYGVRSCRATDTFMKRFTAESYYKLLKHMGGGVIYNHADYRLISSVVLQEFANYKEVNLFLRGLIPLVGFQSTSVFYERHERLAGESHYPLKKMLGLAIEGITSLSVKPIRFIPALGCVFSLLGAVGMLVTLIGSSVSAAPLGTGFLVWLICFFGGVQLLAVGVIGEYIGKIYLETKARPRYIISERTYTTKRD